MAVDTFETAIRGAIDQHLAGETARIVEEEIAAAQARVADRIHKATADAAIRTVRFYDLERHGERLIITVRMPAAD